MFAEWLDTQHRIALDCEERYGIRVHRINGQVSGGLRLELVRRFSEAPGFGVLVLGPRAAGVGLNITAANHVIHYTRHWNPALEQQATDRAYRIGQTRPVRVYVPILVHPAETSIEVHLDALIAAKQALARDVLVPTDVAALKRGLEARVFGGEAA